MLSKERRKLEFAEPLDTNLWTDDPEFNHYIDDLSNRLCNKSTQLGKLKQSTITKHLKILVLNLWCIWIKDKKKHLFVSRDKHYYSTLIQRYNPNKFSFKNVVVMDALAENNFIEMKIGQYRTKFKRRTRIRATPKLIQEIVKKFKINPSVIQLARNAECIILREKDAEDEKKKINVEYKDNKRIKDMRSNLIEYNNLLIDFVVRLQEIL